MATPEGPNFGGQVPDETAFALGRGLHKDPSQPHDARLPQDFMKDLLDHQSWADLALVLPDGPPAEASPQPFIVDTPGYPYVEYVTEKSEIRDVTPPPEVTQ